MRADAVVIGSELDGLMAAIRLQERGHSVCLVASGAGSLHYASGGMRVLGSVPNGIGRHTVTVPLVEATRLDLRHPYSLTGADRMKCALEWSIEPLGRCGIATSAPDDSNKACVTAAGLHQPALMPAKYQATFDRIGGKRVAVVQFEGYRDLPAALLVAALRQAGVTADAVRVAPPDENRDSLGLARGFDRLNDAEEFFARMKKNLPGDLECALFPAVLGFDRHGEIVGAASAALGISVLEVPTLPPSVPGMRCARILEAELVRNGCTMRKGVRIVAAVYDGDRVRAVVDQNGRRIEADAFVLSTGGVLMGGLDVDTAGRIRETALDLAVVQSEPLAAGSPAATLAALHGCGIATDSALRPCRNGSAELRNVFVTGRTLAHWHPAEEISSEGVSIVTGWVAAESAHAEIGR